MSSAEGSEFDAAGTDSNRDGGEGDGTAAGDKGSTDARETLLAL